MLLSDFDKVQLLRSRRRTLMTMQKLSTEYPASFKFQLGPYTLSGSIATAMLKAVALESSKEWAEVDQQLRDLGVVVDPVMPEDTA